MPRLMPMKRSSGERTGEGAVLSDKGSPRKEDAIVPIPETSSLGGPRGAGEPICPAVPSPLPALGSAPPSTQEGVRRWHRLFEEGNESPHSSLWKEMPSLWGRRGRGYSVEGGRAPRLACQPQAAASTPAPAPSRPGLQPRGLRSGEGHLWWFAWRGRRRGEGRSPKWAWRRA